MKIKEKSIFVLGVLFGLIMLLCAYRLFETENLEIFIPFVITTSLFGLFTWASIEKHEKPNTEEVKELTEIEKI